MNFNSGVKIELKPFLHWWMRELSFFVPTRVLQFFHTPRAIIIVRLVDNQFELNYQINTQSQFLATLTKDGSNAQTIKTLIDDDRFKNAIFVLRLSNSEALCKTLNLPLAAQANVSQVVSYELDRYTPFKTEQVYFATHVERLDNEAAQLVVQLLITPRKLLETLYEDCKTLAITPHYVDVESCPNNLQQLHSAYNLLPSHLQPKIANTPRRIIVGLLTLFVILSISSLALPVWLESQAVNELQIKISAIEKDVKTINALQADMETLRTENQALINEKIAVPPVVAILNEISVLMKDDSWLSYLQYSESEVQLQGESQTASNLLVDLEASDYFAKASFASPVTQDKASGMERFQISAEITKPANIENVKNSDVITKTTAKPVAGTIAKLPQENFETETESAVEDVTTQEVVTENGISKE